MAKSNRRAIEERLQTLDEKLEFTPAEQKEYDDLETELCAIYESEAV